MNTEPATDDTVFGPPGRIDFGGALDDDETLFDGLEEPGAPAPARPALEPTRMFARQGSKYRTFVNALGRYGPRTYVGLEHGTDMSASSLANHGMVLRREGYVRNVNPNPHGPRVWIATQEGYEAAGLDYVETSFRDLFDMVSAVCEGDWLSQTEVSLNGTLDVTPRSAIRPRHAGGVYELPVSLGGMGPHKFPYPHVPAFVTHRHAPSAGERLVAGTGHVFLPTLPDPNRLKAILRRYDASDAFEGVVFGSHREDVLTEVAAVAHKVGLAGITWVELYQPSAAVPFDLGEWADV